MRKISIQDIINDLHGLYSSMFNQGLDLVYIWWIHQLEIKWKNQSLVICIRQFCSLIKIVFRCDIWSTSTPLVDAAAWVCWRFKLSRHSLVPSVSLACSHGEHRSRVLPLRRILGLSIIEDIRGVKFRFRERWEENRLLTPGQSRVRLNESPSRIVRIFGPLLSHPFLFHIRPSSLLPLFTLPLYLLVSDAHRSRVHDLRAFRNYLENGHGRPFLETGPVLDMHHRARRRQW